MLSGNMLLMGYLAENNVSKILITAVAGLPMAWICWRLWRFNILPAIHHEYPSPFPYMIPYIGHLRGMMKNPQALFAKAIAHFPSRAIFTLTIMGEEIYIATSPQDINSIYKDTQNLDFDAVISDLLTEFGIAKSILNKLYDKDILPGPAKGRNWMDRQHDVYRAQMLPGSPRGDALAEDLVARIDQATHWTSLVTPIILKPQQASTDGSKLLSLWKWCSHVLVDAATRAFFGDSLVKCEPAFVANYLEFDENYWRQKAKSPKIAAETKKKCVSALHRWLQLPKSERMDACWMVAKTEQDFSDMGITDREQLAKLLFINYEVINGNAYKSAFWLLAHILFDQNLYEEIRTEINTASSASPESKKASSFDMTKLLDSALSPYLNAAYEEVLRLENNAMGVRLVTKETIIGDRSLRPGHKLLMPYRQMHLDESSSIWRDYGSSRPASEYDAQRFLRNKDLTRNPNFRPFGGGNGYCPGRFLARREVFVFVAAVLDRFQISLNACSVQNFPELDLETPTGGILTPKAGHDVIVRAKTRAGYF